jgi:hypothetical protein
MSAYAFTYHIAPNGTANLAWEQRLPSLCHVPNRRSTIWTRHERWSRVQGRPNLLLVGHSPELLPAALR